MSGIVCYDRLMALMPDMIDAVGAETSNAIERCVILNREYNLEAPDLNAIRLQFRDLNLLIRPTLNSSPMDRLVNILRRFHNIDVIIDKEIKLDTEQGNLYMDQFRHEVKDFEGANPNLYKNFLGNKEGLKKTKKIQNLFASATYQAVKKFNGNIRSVNELSNSLNNLKNRIYSCIETMRSNIRPEVRQQMGRVNRSRSNGRASRVNRSRSRR